MGSVISDGGGVFSTTILLRVTLVQGAAGDRLLFLGDRLFSLGDRSLIIFGDGLLFLGDGLLLLLGDDVLLLDDDDLLLSSAEGLLVGALGDLSPLRTTSATGLRVLDLVLDLGRRRRSGERDCDRR